MTTTSPAARLRARSGSALWWLGLGVAVVAAAVVAAAVDRAALADTWTTLRSAPLSLAAVVAAYAAAFALRAAAWRRTLPSLPFGHGLAALHVSTGTNHVLPLRLGEVLRVTSVIRRARVGAAAATASTVSMRAADLLALGSLAAVLGPGLAFDVVGAWGPALLVVSALATVGGGTWLARLRRGGDDVRIPGPLTLAMVAASWILEAAVVHQAAAWAGFDLDVASAVLVTAVTIAAQAVAIAPGGFGTYEAAATAVLVTLGADPGTALAVALTAHAVKTAYALVTGAVAAFVPAPSLVGRLRMPPRTAAGLRVDPAPAAPRPTDADRPVVLFLPAHDEEAAVGAVVARVPARVAGHPVRCVVVDDGSTDRTAERAALAGAEVVSLGRNTGLGAAVRRGLAEGVARDAVAVAFCDADGEYAPEELGALVAPILAGSADYVVGSRFAGDIARMLPHRRLGNRVLTVLLRFVTRVAISDGQSGYRALSAAAAREARVAHDFNYAQVLTIDLLARGARYAEVPISYRFRETGRSFVRLGRYLAAVVPTVHRELNREPELEPVEALSR